MVSGRFLGILFGIAVPLQSSAAAQTNTGEIGGVVRDASGGVLPGAVVTATHRTTGTAVERVSDTEGRFFLPALQIGEWDVTVTLPGFTPQALKGVMLEIGRTVNLEFMLGVQGLEEQVVVQSPIPLLQTSSAEISDVIENREVVQIPLNGRNFLALAQLSDAVVIPPGGTRGEALQQAGPLPNVGGQRSGHNIYLLDGVKVTDETLQQSRHQSIGRFDPGVPDPEVDVPRRIRRQSVGPHQCGDSRRLEHVPGQRLRVPQERSVRLAQLFSPEG